MTWSSSWAFCFSDCLGAVALVLFGLKARKHYEPPRHALPGGSDRRPHNSKSAAVQVLHMQTLPSRGGILSWRQDHHHLAALELGFGLNLGEAFGIPLHLVEQLHA